MPGAVRNADRIWVRTPQNRTYWVWGVLAADGTAEGVFF